MQWVQKIIDVSACCRGFYLVPCRPEGHTVQVSYFRADNEVSVWLFFFIFLLIFVFILRFLKDVENNDGGMCFQRWRMFCDCLA